MIKDKEKIRELIREAIKEPIPPKKFIFDLDKDWNHINKIESIPIALRTPEQHDIYKFQQYSNNLKYSSNIINIIEIIVEHNGSLLMDIDDAINYLTIEPGAFQDAPSETIFIDEITALITFGIKKEWLHKAIKKDAYDMAGQVWRYNTEELPFYDRQEILLNLSKIIGGFRDYYDKIHPQTRRSGWVDKLNERIVEGDNYCKQNISYRNDIYAGGNDGERNPWAVIGDEEKKELQKLGYNVL